MKTASNAPGGMMGRGMMDGLADRSARKLKGKQVLAEVPAESAAPDTESYDKIVDNPFPSHRQRTTVDFLDRRRHRQLCQRPPVSEPEHAATQRCGAH